MLQRSSLFGYAGASHQPQGNVLSSEEEYGALLSDSLFEEEEYGGVLDDEEDYVDDIDLDDDDDDDDDEFGSLYDSDDDEDEDDDYEAMGAYGADPDASIDASISELDAELDGDMYGAWYGRDGGSSMVPAEAQEYVAVLADALNVGALMPAWTQSGLGSYIAQAPMEYVNDLVTGRETREISIYLMLEPGFANWNMINDQQRAGMVYNAIVKAAVPGIEMSFDEPLRRAFSGSVWEKVKAVPSALFNFWTADFPRIVGAGLTEMGINMVDNQLINGVAVRYLAMGYMFPQVYGWLADAVTRDAQPAIMAMQQATKDLGPIGGPMNPPVGPIVQPPPQALATGTGFPDAAQVLGIGTGLIVTGAIFGIFG